MVTLASLPAVPAGMPSLTLTDAATFRLEAISFFLVGVLLSAAAVRWLWNLLRRDFTRMPRLTYRNSAGLVVLWGLLFVIVLTMISGARELMTPGAWEKQGLTYRRASDDEDPPPPKPVEDGDVSLNVRRERLLGLAAALIRFAARHEGRYPGEDELDEIPAEARELPDRFGLKYLYRPGRTVDDDLAILAWEPEAYDDEPFVLFADGTIGRLSFETLSEASPAEASP